MSNFTTILANTEVASSNNGVTVSNGFRIINGLQLLDNLKKTSIGNKDGSHFLRSGLLLNKSGQCLPRSSANTQSMANIIILDCDKKITSDGEITDGAPDPHEVAKIMRENNIAHLIYGSYSHYVGSKGNRYRIIIPTKIPYNKDQLESTLESIISRINSGLNNDLLANANENNTWPQPWYYPRKPANSNIEDLYLEYIEGEALEVTNPISKHLNDRPQKNKTINQSEISPIDAFNEQNNLTELLNFYGYKKVYKGNDYEKWLSPNSTSGIAGIRVEGNKFFSHHGSCIFNDGYWHDSFDLMRLTEGLSEKEAVKKVAQLTLAPNGKTVHEHNYSQKKADKDNIIQIENNQPTKPIAHSEILNQLIK